MCRGVSHTPSMAANTLIQRWYYVRCQHFISAHIRAYAIRPYTYSVEIRASLGENTITNRPIQSSCYHRINGKYVGTYRIRPSRRRTFQQKSLSQNEASLQIPLPLLFSCSPTWRAYALAPLRFSCDAGTVVFSHHGLRNCFTIQDELANGERSSAGRQWYFRDGEPWFEIRAKYICHLRNEDCFLRKTAIATAMEVDHLAQTVIAFAEMRLSLRQSDIRNCRSKIVPCANRHRICRNEIVPPTK